MAFTKLFAGRHTSVTRSQSGSKFSRPFALVVAVSSVTETG